MLCFMFSAGYSSKTWLGRRKKWNITERNTCDNFLEIIPAFVTIFFHPPVRADLPSSTGNFDVLGITKPDNVAAVHRVGWFVKGLTELIVNIKYYLCNKWRLLTVMGSYVVILRWYCLTNKAYLEAGADIIETNTFNSNCLSQKDFDLQNIVSGLPSKGCPSSRQSIAFIMSVYIYVTLS